MAEISVSILDSMNNRLIEVSTELAQCLKTFCPNIVIGNLKSDAPAPMEDNYYNTFIRLSDTVSDLMRGLEVRPAEPIDQTKCPIDACKLNSWLLFPWTSDLANSISDYLTNVESVRDRVESLRTALVNKGTNETALKESGIPTNLREYWDLVVLDTERLIGTFDEFIRELKSDYQL